MVETTDYLIVGFIGNPLEVGFGEEKSLPCELYFDYLGIDKSGNLYVQRGKSPLIKLLHPEYDGAGEFNEGTHIGIIGDERFYEALKKETLTREEIRKAFIEYTKLSLKNGIPYVFTTFVTKGDILNLSGVAADLCYKYSGDGTSSDGYFVRQKKKIGKIRDGLEENDEMNHVYMIIPEKSPIVYQVAEIYRRMFQQQDLS